MPHTWKQARDAYCYPVDLRKFTDASKYRDWFKENIKPGDRGRTMAFEDRFRKHGPDNLEAWGEVVFWKNYTMPPARNRITRKVLAGGVSGASADDLWQKCIAYVDKFDLESFREFRKLLFKDRVVATAATFPAFVCPEKFPMVDTWITDWAVEHGAEHRYPDGPALECVPHLGRGKCSGKVTGRSSSRGSSGVDSLRANSKKSLERRGERGTSRWRSSPRRDAVRI